MKRIITLCSLIVLMSSASHALAHNAGWMAGLPDTVKVCRVSIPGTHDSGTAGVRFPMKHYARTQTMDLAEQWDAGIRFFDLRPKLDKGELKIYHGPANCHLTFKEALLTLKGKLELNPTEFCIVMTNSAGGGQAAVNMTMKDVYDVLPAGMIAVFKPGMTVRDIRGQILFIHRNAPSEGTDAPGVLTNAWPADGLNQKAGLVSQQGERAVLWAQDYYTSGNNSASAYLDIKWRMMQHLLDDFTGAEDEVWCINHASGYTGTCVRTNIGRNREATNARLLEYLRGHEEPVGIIPVDFPAPELIDAIIILNTFASEK